MSTPAKKTKATAMPQTQTPAAAIDWGSYAGETGLGNVSQSDLGIPFINIIQPKGAEVDRTHRNYATKKIEGAGAGDIINTVKREVICQYGKGSIEIVPCSYEKTYNEWQPNRGGLVRVHRDPAILNEVTGKTEKNESVLRNGNLLIETASFYVLFVQPGEAPMPAVINMSSTGLKQARHWLNLMTGLRVGPNRVTPPAFSHSYNLTSAIETNAKGSWYGWSITLKEQVQNRDIVNAALGIAKQVSLLADKQKAQIPAQASTTDADEEVPM